MTWREFCISFIYWLPWPGEALVKKLFHEAEYRRLSFDAPDSFYVSGISKHKQALRQRFADEADRMHYLLHEGIIGDFCKHTLVSVALAYRGIWIVKYWTLLLSLHSFISCTAACFGAGPRLLIFALPAIFMLGLHAFVSVNVHRYNIILMPVWRWRRLVCHEGLGMGAKQISTNVVVCRPGSSTDAFAMAVFNIVVILRGSKKSSRMSNADDKLFDKKPSRSCRS